MATNEFNARAMRKVSAKNYHVSTEELRANCRELIERAASIGRRAERPFVHWEAYEDSGLAKVQPQAFQKVIKELEAAGFTVKVHKHLISRKPDYFNAIVRW